MDKTDARLAADFPAEMDNFDNMLASTMEAARRLHDSARAHLESILIRPTAEWRMRNGECGKHPSPDFRIPNSAVRILSLSALHKANSRRGPISVNGCPKDGRTDTDGSGLPSLSVKRTAGQVHKLGRVKGRLAPCAFW